MRAQEIMTGNPACCTPNDTLERAAKLMADMDCGCLPVVSDMASKEIVGVVTDRDLACRCLGGRQRRGDSGLGGHVGQSELLHRGFQYRRSGADRGRAASEAGTRSRREQLLCRHDRAGRPGRADRESSRDVRRTVEQISEPIRAPRANTGVGVRPS